MRRLPAWLPFVPLWLLLTVSVLAQGLDADVRRILRATDLKGGTVAVSIRDTHRNTPLVAHNADQAMIPASNMKLLTTGAALHVLGPTFEFRSQMRLRGDQLIVIGDGDPGFGDPELLAFLTLGERQGVTIEEFLDLWVQPIVRANIKHLREVVVDDRVFDREFIHESWPREQLNARYCAEVSGMNIHLNLLYFYPRPVPGERPDVSRFEPYAPWIPITNTATSRNDRADTNAVGISRPARSNRLTIYGNVKIPFVAPAWVTIHHPSEFFAHLLTDRLRRAGVQVGAFRCAEADEDLGGGETIGPIIRTPIGSALVRCNRDSYNLYAEALFKRTGHAVTNGQPGSFANGAAAIRLVADQRLGDPSAFSSIIIADGSGLSRDNRVTADFLTRWLNSLERDERLRDAMLNSLAVGSASGTLSSRFRSRNLHGAIIHAKSGSINGVSTLSGYVTMPDGRRRSFSVLMNNLDQPNSVTIARQLQEQIVEAIARNMALQPAGTVDFGG